MGNPIVWIIEDNIIARKLLNREAKTQNLFEESQLVVSKNYDEALAHLESFDQESILYVILDCELGDQHKRNGVDLFGLIRQKFPSAYIINYSSTPNAFAKAVCHRFPSRSHGLFDSVASKDEQIYSSTSGAEPQSSKIPDLAIKKIKSELIKSADTAYVNTTARLRSDSDVQNPITFLPPLHSNDQKSVSVCCSCWSSLYWPTFSQKKTPKRVYVTPLY